MRWIVVCILIVLMGFMAYVRLVPANLETVHRAIAPRDPGDYPTAGSFTAVRAITTPPEGVLTAVMQLAAQTPRTRVLDGSVEDGIITFETRSKIMGFPDYTTVSIIPEGAAPGGNDGPLLMIHARLRFGQSDMGVNRARVESWLDQLGPLVVAP